MSKGDDSFEELFLKEKKKSTIMMAITAIAIVIAIGSGVWGMNQASKAEELANAANSGPFSGQTPPNGNFPGGPGGGFRGGPNGGFGVERFFNDDGSVNQDEVDQFLTRVPQGGDSNFLDFFTQNIDQAVEDGTITEAQASALKGALNTTSGAVNES